MGFKASGRIGCSQLPQSAERVGSGAAKKFELGSASSKCRTLPLPRTTGIREGLGRPVKTWLVYNRFVLPVTPRWPRASADVPLKARLGFKSYIASRVRAHLRRGKLLQPGHLRFGGDD
eukprot:2658216-Pyramimonas_sp.AAC.1